MVVTTVNTITGFLPLAISSSPLWPPMAIAMIGGLTMSMPVCFVMVPAAYTLVARAQRSNCRRIATKRRLAVFLGPRVQYFSQAEMPGISDAVDDRLRSTRAQRKREQ